VTTDIYTETYIDTRRSGVTHIAGDGKTDERCNVDQIADRRDVGSLEDLGAVTRKTIRFCRWCAPEDLR
jgi:hypothetical protein